MFECPKPKNWGHYRRSPYFCYTFGIFVIRYCFGFRASDFEFAVLNLWHIQLSQTTLTERGFEISLNTVKRKRAAGKPFIGSL